MAKKFEFSIIAKFKDLATGPFRRMAKGIGRASRIGFGAGGLGIGSFLARGGVFGIFRGVVRAATAVASKVISIFTGMVGAVVKVFTTMVSTITGILGKITKVATVAALGAGAAFVYFLQKTAKVGDELAKMSRRTGMSVKFLSEMQHVLAINDARLADLQKAFKGIATFVVNAMRETKEYTDVLDALGMTLYRTDGRMKSSERLFMEFTDALRKVKSEVLRAGYAQLIFGRSAQSLLPTIISTTGSIRELREEAQRLGITWSKTDARAAEDFRDALTRLWGSLKGIWLAFMKPLLKPFTGEVESLAEALTKLQSWARKAGTALAGLIARIKEYFSGRVWKWETIKEGLRDTLRYLKELAFALPRMIARVGEKGWELGPLGQTIVAVFKIAAARIREIFAVLWVNIGEDMSIRLGAAMRRMGLAMGQQAAQAMKTAAEAPGIWAPAEGKEWEKRGWAGRFIRAPLSTLGETITGRRMAPGAAIQMKAGEAMAGVAGQMDAAGRALRKTEKTDAQKAAAVAEIRAEADRDVAQAATEATAAMGELAKEVRAVPPPQAIAPKMAPEARAAAGREGLLAGLRGRPEVQKFNRWVRDLEISAELLRQYRREGEADAVAGRATELRVAMEGLLEGIVEDAKVTKVELEALTIFVNQMSLKVRRLGRGTAR